MAKQQKTNPNTGMHPALTYVEALHNPTPLDNSSLSINTQAQDEISFSPTIAAIDCHFIKLNELGFDDKMPRRESLENVISAMNNSAFNFVYLLSGHEKGVDLYLGVVRDYHKISDGRLHAYDYGELLRESFLGNFHGSEITDITTQDDLQQTVFAALNKCKRGSVITGIPSVNEASESKELYTQKLDSLVNSMSGVQGSWQLLIVCDSMPLGEKNKLKSYLFDIYEEVYLASKFTRQDSRGSNESKSATISSSKSKSENTGTSSSDTSGNNKSSNGSSSSSGSSESHTKGVNNGISIGSNESESKANSEGTSFSQTTSTEHIDKEYQALLKYMDEELFERIDIGLVKGLFRTSIYALAENVLAHQRLVSNLTAMWQGDSSSFSPLRITELPNGITDDLRGLFCHFQYLQTKNPIGVKLASILGLPSNTEQIELRTNLTSRELSLICALPRKEVPGLPLRKAVDFGLNPTTAAGKDAINMGNVFHQGSLLSHQVFSINKEMLSRHVFVAGVTGSGKTTTCRRLLTESQLPFLVIEPAKTEYRSLLSEIGEMEIYTLGNENLAPFRFNPFELMQGESITSHVDLLKAAFTAAFPMEAAMPYLLEEAIYESYKDYGWNTDGWYDQEDANLHSSNPWQENGRYWPTMDDLLKNMDKVVKSKNFDQRLESDYTASLVARFKNLTVGAKGQMLNCRVSTDITRLLDKKVILELDDLKSPEDKCLMMGLVIARFSEAIKLRYIEQPDYKHVTLIEEAHRLLEKPSPSDEGSRKHAVGMFTDLLAEVRKYGESLVIVDQIPNKLAPEVLKNTNTKIIHKLFARDDREAIGDTVGLDEEQKNFLPNLRIGEVIAYSGDWKKAIHAKIKQVGSDDRHSDAELITKVRTVGLKQYIRNQAQYLPEISATKIELDEGSLKLYTKKKRKFWHTLNEVIENAIKEAGEIVSKGSNIKKKTMPFILENIAKASSTLSDCQNIKDLITADLILKLPVNTDTDELNSYQESIAKLLAAKSEEHIQQIAECHTTNKNLQSLFNQIY